MSKLIKRELFLVAQFFTFVLIACLAAFIFEFIPGGNEYINIKEAWKNIEPFIGRILTIFTALSVVRLALILATSRIRSHQ